MRLPPDRLPRPFLRGEGAAAATPSGSSPSAFVCAGAAGAAGAAAVAVSCDFSAAGPERVRALIVVKQKRGQGAGSKFAHGGARGGGGGGRGGGIDESIPGGVLL